MGLGELGVGGGGGDVLEEEVLVLALEGAVPGLQEELHVELAFEASVLVGAKEGVVLGLERAVLEEQVLVGQCCWAGHNNLQKLNLTCATVLQLC